jgi:hypothetical protein
VDDVDVVVLLDPDPDEGAVEAAAMSKVSVVLAEAFKESVTSKPKVEAAELVAVPEIVPVLELSVSPAGITPDTCDHVNGATPPFTDSGAEYDAPTLPEGNEVVVI